MSISRYLDWLWLRDYDDAILAVRIAIIKRFARGNVSFQNGAILDEEAVIELRAKGDRALDRLVAQQEAYQKNAGHKALPRPA